MPGKNGWTETEKRILAVLADGLSHSRAELIACLWDELSGVESLKVHICNMRKVLRPMGQDIICEDRGRAPSTWRHVRLLHSPYQG